jgi:hypothetical protein
LTWWVNACFGEESAVEITLEDLDQTSEELEETCRWLPSPEQADMLMKIAKKYLGNRHAGLSFEQALVHLKNEERRRLHESHRGKGHHVKGKSGRFNRFNVAEPQRHAAAFSA